MCQLISPLTDLLGDDVWTFILRAENVLLEWKYADHAHIPQLQGSAMVHPRLRGLGVDALANLFTGDPSNPERSR